MTMNKRDEEMLEGIVCGAVDARAPEVRARLNGDPALRAQLDELLDLQKLLGDDSKGMREILEAGGEAPVLRHVPGGVSRMRRLVTVLAGVAALLLVVFLPQFMGGDGDPLPGRGQMLGGQRAEVSAVLPTGAGSSFEVFEYSSKFSDDEVLSKIRIWAFGADEDAEPLHKESFAGTRWTPSPELSSSLPDQIRWELSIFDLSDKPIDRFSVDFAAR